MGKQNILTKIKRYTASELLSGCKQKVNRERRKNKAKKTRKKGTKENQANVFRERNDIINYLTSITGTPRLIYYRSIYKKCDITASNTGHLKGTCVLFEQKLEKDVPHRHHILPKKCE